MFSINKQINDEFMIFRKDAAEKSICCEMVTGHVVKSMMTNEEGRKLCFMLGTLLEDYFIIKKKCDCTVFGPVDVILDESNIFQPDLFTVSGDADMMSEKCNQLPKIVIEILSSGNVIYDCLDKAIAYRDAGVKEYWLIDMNAQFVYTYGFQKGFQYKRYTFEQSIRSQYYVGFECCISDIMWQDSGSLKELALFYRFKQEMYPDSKNQVVAEAESLYCGFDEGQYTAEAFYEWIATRKNMNKYANIVELLFGNIREFPVPAFRHQNIRGDLYFTIKYFLKTRGLPYQLLFAPIAVELKKMDLLDSVVMPDLFLINKEEVILDNVYRGVPEWVIEIASPATAAQDYIDKAQLYQYHGVREYWIINDWKRQTLVLYYKNQTAEQYEENVESYIYDFDEMVPVKTLPGLEIVMNDVLKLP